MLLYSFDVSLHFNGWCNIDGDGSTLSYCDTQGGFTSYECDDTKYAEFNDMRGLTCKQVHSELQTQR